MEPKRISRFLREISNLLIRFTDIHFENLMYLSLFFVKVGARIFISDSIGISERTRRNFIRCCVVGGGGPAGRERVVATRAEARTNWK